MKKMKICALLLCAALLLPMIALGEEAIIIDKIKNKDHEFAFAEDAKLLEVYFPKINGCDGAFVRYGDYAMIIDCAGNQWKEMKAMLDWLGVKEVNYALNSHPDADHIGGFNHVLKEIPAGEFLHGFPEDYPEGDEVRFKIYEDLHKLEIPFRQVHHGEELAFGDVKVIVQQRTENDLARVNNKSAMLKIQLGERSIFFSGDIQRDGQLKAIADKENMDIQADILKAPHHGYNPMQAGFLEMIDPSLVIITSGNSTANGKQQLKDEKIPYYVCEMGIIRLATDGNVWTIERFKK